MNLRRETALGVSPSILRLELSAMCHNLASQIPRSSFRVQRTYWTRRREGIEIPTRDRHCGVSQRTQERDQVSFFLLRELHAQDHVEELDCILKRQKTSIVEIWGRLLHATKRERLDRTIGGSHHAVHHMGFVETLCLQIMHEVIRIEGRGMTFGAPRFAEK